jgi:hypothetical protein
VIDRGPRTRRCLDWAQSLQRLGSAKKRSPAPLDPRPADQDPAAQSRPTAPAPSPAPGKGHIDERPAPAGQGQGHAPLETRTAAAHGPRRRTRRQRLPPTWDRTAITHRRSAGRYGPAGRLKALEAAAGADQLLSLFDQLPLGDARFLDQLAPGQDDGRRGEDVQLAPSLARKAFLGGRVQLG